MEVPTLGNAVYDLHLPMVARHHASGRLDALVLQRYADFASKAEEKNPSVTFDKEFMDDAFRLAVSKMARKASAGGSKGSIDTMLIRASDFNQGVSYCSH